MKTIKLYSIKPLKWEKEVDLENNMESNTAGTFLGYYYVDIFNDTGCCYWGYVFENEEGRYTSESFKDGKEKAWEHWQERIGKALEDRGTAVCVRGEVKCETS